MPTMPVYDERQLLARIALDDKAAFTCLYHQYHGMVKQVVVKLIKSRPLSDDIVQEIFIKIWNGRDRLPAINSFKAYLLVVSQNHTLSFLKTAARDQALGRELMAAYPAFRNPVEETVMSKEYWQCVEEVLRSMPQQTRHVFSLCRQQDKTYEEVAHDLGISRDAVKKHMVRANKIFRISVKNLLDISMRMLALVFFLK